MKKLILVLNTSSSSIKFTLFDATAPPRASLQDIIYGLGSALALTIRNDTGKSIATTMGFTVLDGLMMGTRCGTLDPGVMLYLLREKALGPEQIEDLHYRRSGLLGVSGISSDMRELLASATSAAKEAIDLFCYRAVREIGSLIAALGGLDALIFTAAIGERSHDVRERICERLDWLGLELDAAANRAHQAAISSAASRIAVCVIPTNEEAVIARHTARVIASQ